MATRGVFQLRKLTVRYCNYGGSSKGVRDFIRSHIVEFARCTPHAQVETELRPGHHPYILGDYETGKSKQIGVKNLSPKEVMDYAMMLRNTSGRKVKKLKNPVESRYPSVQGVWEIEAPLHTVDFKLRHYG